MWLPPPGAILDEDGHVPYEENVRVLSRIRKRPVSAGTSAAAAAEFVEKCALRRSANEYLRARSAYLAPSRRLPRNFRQTTKPPFQHWPSWESWETSEVLDTSDEQTQRVAPQTDNVEDVRDMPPPLTDPKRLRRRMRRHWRMLLLQSAARGDLGAAQKAFKKGARPLKSRDEGGLTPLHLCAVNGSTEVAAWLLQLPEDRGHRLIEACDDNGRLPLMLAVAHGRAEIVALLLKHGAKIDSRDMLGRTAVAHGNEHGQRDLVNLIKTERRRRVEERAKARADRLAKFEKRHGYAKALRLRVEMKQEDRRQVHY